MFVKIEPKARRRPFVTIKEVAKPEKLLREILEKCDSNGDHKLSKAELKVAFGKLGSRAPAFRAWRGMAKADANRDGAIDLDTKELDDLINYCIAHDYAIKV